MGRSIVCHSQSYYMSKQTNGRGTDETRYDVTIISRIALSKSRVPGEVPS